jgi:hypothetical protein
MEALSTLKIGKNVLRVQVQGAQQRLVAAIATAQAGCTPGTRDGARTNTRLPLRRRPLGWEFL